MIVTYLEMHAPGQLRAARCDDERLYIREQTERDWRFNRDMYLAVGESWSWKDKRDWTDEQWQEYGTAPELKTFAAWYGGSLAGYYELRRDDAGGVEIAYFGLLPEFIGRGFGGALYRTMHRAGVAMAPSISAYGCIPVRTISARAGQLPGQGM